MLSDQAAEPEGTPAAGRRAGRGRRRPTAPADRRRPRGDRPARPRRRTTAGRRRPARPTAADVAAAEARTCLNCPRWRRSGRAWPSGSPAGGSPRSRYATRGRSAGTCPAARTSPASLAGRTVHRRPPPGQVPVAAAGQRRRGRRPPRHVRAAAAATGRRRPTRRTCGSGSASTTTGPSCASSTSAPSAGWRSREGGAELPAEIAHIARDPMDPDFSDADFVAALRRRRTEVKRALLDQTLISGVGNIYADEALWRAGLHGARPTDALTRPAAAPAARPRPGRARRGARAGRHQLRRALRQRQRRERLLRPVAERLRPGGQPCRRCGTPIRREAFMNRSSFSCPRCQPRPRGALRG